MTGVLSFNMLKSVDREKQHKFGFSMDLLVLFYRSPLPLSTVSTENQSWEGQRSYRLQKDFFICLRQPERLHGLLLQGKIDY